MAEVRKMTEQTHKRRRHPARRARMAVTGLGVAAVLGLGTAMGGAGHLIGRETVATGTSATPSAVASLATPTPSSRASNDPQPIKLSARRVVRKVVVVAPAGATRPAARAVSAAPASAPAASTSGS
jgi:hypothetical protein